MKLREVIKDETLLNKLLEEFFYEKVIKRGQNYKKDGNVKNYTYITDNYIHGAVFGSQLYYTDILYDPSTDSIFTFCSCPYELYCKHAVSILLQAHEDTKHTGKSNTNTKKKKKQDAGKFFRDLYKGLQEYPFVNFWLENSDWMDIVKSHDPKTVLKHLRKFIREIEDGIETGNIYCNDDVDMKIDKILIDILGNFKGEEKVDALIDIMKALSDVSCFLISGYGRILSSFSEEEIKMFKEKLKKEIDKDSIGGNYHIYLLNSL